MATLKCIGRSHLINSESCAPVDEVTIRARGLLFDMDGVLISSTGAVERCWKKWCEAYGVPDAKSFEVPHGMRAVEVVRMLKPKFDEAQVAAGLRAIEDLEVADTTDLTALPGAKTLLETLPPERWAIVTSATKRLMLGRLAAAGLPVPERVVCADMVERGKPDPEPYRRGAALLGLSPADCVVVEDAPSGVSAGIAAGCPVLAVMGTHDARDLREATWIALSLSIVDVRIADNDDLELHFANLAQ